MKLNGIAKQLNLGSRRGSPGGAKSENTSPPIAPCGGEKRSAKRNIKWQTPFLSLPCEIISPADFERFFSESVDLCAVTSADPQVLSELELNEFLPWPQFTPSVSGRETTAETHISGRRPATL